MRQAKGKTKETTKEKRQRKKDFEDVQRKLFTIVLPTIAGIAIFVAAYVYIKTRPQNYISV